MAKVPRLPTLALRSARFYWRTDLCVLVGTVVAVAVLTGAMLVGDSVNFSLRRFALLRLGKTRSALQTQHRFFQQTLGRELQEKLPETQTAVALQLKGVAIRQDPAAKESKQVNNIRVLGITPEFWTLSDAEGPALAEGEAAVNRRLAIELDVMPGDDISIRIEKPGLLPKDAPLSSRKEGLTGRAAFIVTRILDDTELGRFSLTANQIAPNNAFVNLARLQRTVDLEDRVNLLVTSTEQDQAEHALKSAWKLEHAGITIRDFEKYDLAQLESDRVFLDPAAANAAMSIALPDKTRKHTAAVGVLTYLVNSISKQQDDDTVKSTPYSFVCACSPTDNRSLAVTPSDMHNDQIIINRWLANEINARPGDKILMTYFELGPSGGFMERSREFSVHSIVEMKDIQAEKELFPEFPGLTDVDTCSDWDIGMPMEEELLADKPNEQYWKDFRETPKAFVTLQAGQEMWANRFGNLSAIRYPLGSNIAELIGSTVRNTIEPAELGLFFIPVREQALRAVSEAMDFGQLFLGMSVFLVAAALMLTGLLFVFGVQRRAEEMGTLLAVGYSPAQVRRLFLCEGSVIAALGSIIGAELGTFYTRALIWGLGAYWQGAVAGSAIKYHAEPETVATGAIAGFACALLAVALSMWRQSHRPATELLQSDFTQIRNEGTAPHRPGAYLPTVLSIAGVAAAVAIVITTVSTGAENVVMPFFGAGSLMLLSGICLAGHRLNRYSVATGSAAAGGEGFSLNLLGMRNAARRSGRSLTVTGLLACGCFMVFAVSSMKEDITAHADKPWSGTGGFELFGESTIAVPDELSSNKTKDDFALTNDERLSGVKTVSVKVHDGDDASCFNLNRAQSPRLLGVPARELAERRAFVPRGEKPELWALLQKELPDNTVPALVGDADTAMWGLEKKTGPEKGDTLLYKDERGNSFQVKLVGKLPMRLSVFQGAILISRKNFNRLYPSEAGYRMFLIDAGEQDVAQVRTALSQKLQQTGLDITTSAERMREFYSVETTYLAMFVVLGGLGLLLGSIGMGIVVMRNMLERRSELALLKCVGFTRSQVIRVVIAEHWLLLVSGVVVGTVSAAVAIWPSLHSPNVSVPYRTLGILLCGVLVIGLLWTVIAAALALRRPLIPALRNE